MKILVIDDNKGILDALRVALKILGHEVQCEPHAKDVLEHVTTFKPDVLILDLLLSGENGSDVCRTLKASEHTKHLPIIMMSAHPSALENVRKAGANDFLPKPFELKHLSELLEKHAPVPKPIAG